MPNAIPCPYCRNIIYFDLALLLKGEAFECSQCHSRISLTPQSRPIVAEASARLEELKQKASRQLDEKPENNRWKKNFYQWPSSLRACLWKI